MARQARSERRARRQGQGTDGVAAPRPVRTPAVPTAPEPAAERRVPGGGFKRFVEESIGELKKVEWPTQHQVVTGTTVVLIACAIVGVFLWVNDKVWAYVVQQWLLGK